MARSGGAAVGAVALSAVGCSDDATDADEGGGEGASGEIPEDGVLVDEDVPPEEDIFGWIEEIFDQGVRRPGYPADEWAEGYVADRFRELGMENVRFEPVEVTRWEPVAWSLEVTIDGGEPVELECFPVPYGPAVDGLEADLTKFDGDNPRRAEGKAVLYDMALLELAGDSFLSAGSSPDDLSRRSFDPDDTLGEPHRLPAAELRAADLLPGGSAADS